MRIPQPPEGSRISIQETSRGTELYWETQAKTEFTRLAAIAFRLFVLVICVNWGYKIIYSLSVYYNEVPQTVKVLYLILLVFCVMGGISMIRSLIKEIRKKDQERIILDTTSMTHDPGEFLDGLEIPEDEDQAASVPVEYKIRKISKEDIGLIQLEKIDDAQVLSIDFGGEKVLVGIFLPEDEKQWLYKVLIDWKEA